MHVEMKFDIIDIHAHAYATICSIYLLEYWYGSLDYKALAILMSNNLCLYNPYNNSNHAFLESSHSFLYYM